MKKHIIWNADLGNLEDWRDAFEDGDKLSDEELFERASELNAEYFYDETDYNLRNAEITEQVVVIGDLGFWYGRRSGYRCITTDNIGDAIKRAAFPVDLSYDEVFVDELGDLRITQHHHDGTNYLTVRTWKPEATERQRDNLLHKLYMGTATRRDITRVTRRLGDDIAAVYGWAK